ncbi:MAG TPA: hypothetical protein VEL79_20365 [Vicinamibacterales bacterium]|nr:hypothetical protein [Vicinamibacterales bacterium]
MIARRARGIIAALAVASIPSLFAAQPPALYDVVITGGRVVDPASGFDGVRNVGISGGRIAELSTSTLRGRNTLDARGLVVAPGFIDVHAHG